MHTRNEEHIIARHQQLLWGGGEAVAGDRADEVEEGEQQPDGVARHLHEADRVRQ
jgi:hypothetical protein